MMLKKQKSDEKNVGRPNEKCFAWAKKSNPGNKVYIDNKDSKPLKEIKFNDFKKLKLVTKNNNIYYQDKLLLFY